MDEDHFGAQPPKRRFPAKQGTPDAEDDLRRYLEAPDLDSARDQIQRTPALLRLDRQAVTEGARQAGTDEVWRVGLLETAREQGLRAAYQAWAELAAIERMGDAPRAVKRLTKLTRRHRGCLRDRTLEILLAYHQRAGDRAAQRAVLQDLIDTRSAGSPPGRRPHDLSVVRGRRIDVSPDDYDDVIEQFLSAARQRQRMANLGLGLLAVGTCAGLVVILAALAGQGG